MTHTEKQNIIEFLIDNELRYLIDNPDRHTLAEVTDFFASGGFHTWDDDKLLKAYARFDEEVS